MPALLAVIPHPDDEAYSFAGTIALAARAGWRCLVHCATDGELGERHDGRAAEPETLGPDRAAELAASCAILGADAPVHWGLPDGGLAGIASQAGRIRATLDDLRPALVLSLGADGAYGHPDHLAVYRWVREAWESLPGERPPLLFAAFPPGLFVPQYEKCVASGIMGDPPRLRPAGIGAAPAHYALDVSSVRPLKKRSIASHRTQLPGGRAEALFPAAIVSALLATERFTDARGERGPAVAATLARFAP